MSSLKALEQTLHHEIPLTQHMGISVYAHDERGLVLSAPLQQNINHKKTVFGGSLNAVATLAGWSMVYLVLQEMQHPPTIVIQKSAIEYLAPVTHDFQTLCERPESKHLEKFQNMFRKKGIGRIQLHCKIYERDTLAVSFRGTYVATAEL